MLRVGVEQKKLFSLGAAWIPLKLGHLRVGHLQLVYLHHSINILFIVHRSVAGIQEMAL